jgi:arsenical pump membrane protein
LAALSLVALVVGVAGAVARPGRLPAWAVPCAAALAVLAAGGLAPSAAATALDPLRAPIAFLLAAVPFAVLLDRYGWFASAAVVLGRRGDGLGGLWVLAAVVTTVLNLDAAVVLLTPLYVTIARQRGIDPMLLAVQPVLLACLASSVLPVSNLTNLIAASATGAGVGQFLSALGLPSLVATCVGWACYRRWAGVRAVAPTAPVRGTVGSAAPAGTDGSARRRLVAGSVLVALVLVGFTAGDAVGIEPWEVVVAADIALLAMLRTHVPWRDVPVGTALVAASLGLLAAAAGAHLPVAHLLAGTGLLAQARVSALAAVAANVANNLPALLVALPAIGHRHGPALWSVLVGVNMGPVLLATGSLASLLWLGTLRRLGIAARARDFSAVGVLVGLPAALGGEAAHLALHSAGIS